ncbi:ACT domain-containing protein [Nymphaea thermarum]|nr:ACT domain-containing protein [Nymphaea thermarum]
MQHSPSPLIPCSSLSSFLFSVASCFVLPRGPHAAAAVSLAFSPSCSDHSSSPLHSIAGRSVQVLLHRQFLHQVESANKHGSLLEVAQILTDFNLTINGAYISSDGQWFMDVFHVTDQESNKIINDDVISRIKQVKCRDRLFETIISDYLLHTSKNAVHFVLL